MKKEDLFEVLGDIDEDSIKNARKYKARRPAWVKWVAAAACIAIVGVAIHVAPSQIRPSENAPAATQSNQISNEKPGEAAAAAGEEATNNTDAVKVVSAAYPDISAMHGTTDAAKAELQEYEIAHTNNMMLSRDLQQGIYNYYSAIMKGVLTADADNTVMSPLNTYIAFAMLAEVTDGNSRQQILDMLGASDIDTLRENISAIWNSNYEDSLRLTSLLGNSLWLNSNAEYKDAVMQVLAEKYFTSTFCGTPGTEEMNEALRKWTDENTGGLLSQYTKDMSLDPSTILSIVSTIYFKASWIDSFRKENTDQQTFHGTKGDTTVDMMHSKNSAVVYRTDSFTSASLPLDLSGNMYFLLPEEGVDVNELLADPDILNVLNADYEDSHYTNATVNLSLPKFKVSAKSDLLNTIRELGITDVLDPALADFSPLTDASGIYVGGAEHAAVVDVNEEGVEGAAYTQLTLETAAEITEEIDLTFDRPFVFMVTGADGSLLFAGAVRNID